MVKMPIWIKPPKSSQAEANPEARAAEKLARYLARKQAGKAVKKQQVDKLLKKTLDKPVKMVYNLRKDVREVQELFRNHIYQEGRVELRGKEGYHVKLASNLLQETTNVVHFCNKHNLPYPTLAGGAIRDFIYNLHPKDYDYFFNCKTEEEAYELIDELTLSLGDYTEGGPSETYGGSDDNFEGVYVVFNVRGDVGPRQFIVGIWNQEEPIYERFDLSICKVMMDIITKDITLSDDFVDSMVNRNIVNYRPDAPYSKKRRDSLIYKLQLKEFSNKRSMEYTTNPYVVFKQNPYEAARWYALPVRDLQVE